MNEPCSGIHTTHQQLESAELGGRRYAPACEQLVYYSTNAVRRKGPLFLPADVHKMDTRSESRGQEPGPPIADTRCGRPAQLHLQAINQALAFLVEIAPAAIRPPVTCYALM